MKLQNITLDTERLKASNMLEFLGNYPNLEQCTIQTFDDIEDKTKVKRLEFARKSQFDDNWIARCEKLNQQKAGIYFSVNSMVA